MLPKILIVALPTSSVFRCARLSFFVAGATPSELDVIYSRCAGSLPKAQRDAVKRTCVAVKGVDCMEKLWKYLAMDSPVTDDLAVRNHIGRYLDYLVAAVPVWEAQNLTADAWNAIKVPPLVTRPIVQKSSSSSVTSSATSKPNASSAQSKHSSSTTVKAKAAATSAAPGKGMGKVAVEAKATRTIPVPQQTVSSVATLGILGFQSEEARLLKEQDAEEQMKHMGWPMLTSTRTLDRNKCCYPRCGRVFSCRSLLFHHLKRVFKGRLAANPGFHVRHRKLTTEETHPDHDAWRSLTCPACHCSFENGNQLRIHYTWLGVEGFWSMEQQTALRKAAANESQEEQEEADMDRIDERQVVNEYVVDIVPASPSPGAPGTHAPVASESTAAVATTQVRSETVMVKSTPLRRNAKEEEFDLLGVCIKCLNAERECIFSPCGHFVACRPCSERAGECPVCRTMVFDFIVLCYGLQSDGRMRGTMAASPRYWVSRVDRTVPRNIGTPDTTPISQLTGMALREVELDATKVAVFQLLMSRTSIAKYMPQDVTSNARYSGFVVKKVFRIENPYLWRSYAHAKHMIRSRFVSHFETKNSELGEIDKKLARVVKDFNGNPEAARDKMNATLAQLHRLQQLREKFEVTTENLCLRDHFAWKTATKGQAWSTDVGWLGYAANDSAPSRPENLTRRQREEIEEAERRYIRMREGVDEEMLSMRNPSSMHYLPEADRKLHSDFMQELALESDINEKVLFHGTDVQYADSIKHNGLDERLSSDYGLFGGGIYFAENATKSDAYCVGMGEKRFMFLSRVCLGTPFVALSALDGRRPPCLELCDSTQPCTHSRYDSVIGEKQANNQDAYLMKHREFVVYDRNQVYDHLRASVGSWLSHAFFCFAYCSVCVCGAFENSH
ncbi:hypothetical protein CAOG_009951 [Capsaspora owczarzaki ATCC 30864]|uniref:Poly [ADP-ribose] polymerase n=1 Tax=Capsaspora owczarzaki (strain ATCC 30864) TaxID=595528 RepID=A0A0D2VW20_CAPO3|nr:hypothetical protein CAOG_009951 [Capsaspora owczarzaki ATCC 30864]